MVKNLRLVQEAVALENGSLNVSVHRGQRVKSIQEVKSESFDGQGCHGDNLK